jgi:hypothetical protein
VLDDAELTASRGLWRRDGREKARIWQKSRYWTEIARKSKDLRQKSHSRRAAVPNNHLKAGNDGRFGQ